MSQPKVDVFIGSAIRKTKRKRIYIKSIPNSYEYPIDYSTKNILAQILVRKNLVVLSRN
jgi:hypothetical protein